MSAFSFRGGITTSLKHLPPQLPSTDSPSFNLQDQFENCHHLKVGTLILAMLQQLFSY
jgi:hypothetical protein